MHRSAVVFLSTATAAELEPPKSEHARNTNEARTSLTCGPYNSIGATGRQLNFSSLGASNCGSPKLAVMASENSVWKCGIGLAKPALRGQSKSPGVHLVERHRLLIWNSEPALASARYDPLAFRHTRHCSYEESGRVARDAAGARLPSDVRLLECAANEPAST